MCVDNILSFCFLQSEHTSSCVDHWSYPGDNRDVIHKPLCSLLRHGVIKCETWLLLFLIQLHHKWEEDTWGKISQSFIVLKPGSNKGWETICQGCQGRDFWEGFLGFLWEVVLGDSLTSESQSWIIQFIQKSSNSNPIHCKSPSAVILTDGHAVSSQAGQVMRRSLPPKKVASVLGLL